ncbi:hypothetical protein J437_LFUL001434, partial [Ladona fulva]
MTELYEINHIKTIYNIFTTSFILLFINIVINDLLTHHTLKLNFDMILWNIDGLEYMVLLWVLMFIPSFIPYICFRLWARTRKNFSSSNWCLQLWDYFWIGIYLVFQGAFLVFPPIFILRNSFPPVASGVLIEEQLRMMMKIHAFIRSNFSNVVSVKSEEKQCSGCPPINKYVYFHFAPTLVYRDEYPRTDKIRWKIVVWHFCEVLGILFYVFCTNEQFLFSHLRPFWDEKVTSVRVLALFFCLLFPSLILLIFGFYLFFHSWMNAFAELLRFGDRMFYQDWWTTTSFQAYYRSWNVVVHDWIFEYMYSDMTNAFSSSFNNNKTTQTTKCRFLSRVLSFFVSAIFHEYVIIVSMRFCYPVLLILFGGVGVALFYVPKKNGATGNIYMWLCISIGTSMLMTAYCVEYFARRHCSPY